MFTKSNEQSQAAEKLPPNEIEMPAPRRLFDRPVSSSGFGNNAAQLRTTLFDEPRFAGGQSFNSALHSQSKQRTSAHPFKNAALDFTSQGAKAGSGTAAPDFLSSGRAPSLFSQMQKGDAKLGVPLRGLREAGLTAREHRLKMTFSQHQTRLNPHSLRALSLNPRPDPFLPRKKNASRRASPPQTIGQKRELRAEIQKAGELPEGGTVLKKFKSASLNQQSALQNQGSASLYQAPSSSHPWLLGSEIKSGIGQLSNVQQASAFQTSFSNPFTNLTWQQKQQSRLQNAQVHLSGKLGGPFPSGFDGVKSLFPVGWPLPHQKQEGGGLGQAILNPKPKFTTSLRQAAAQPVKAGSLSANLPKPADLSLFNKVPVGGSPFAQPDISKLKVSASPEAQSVSEQHQHFQKRSLGEDQNSAELLEADGPGEPSDSAERDSEPISSKKLKPRLFALGKQTEGSRAAEMGKNGKATQYVKNEGTQSEIYHQRSQKQQRATQMKEELEMGDLLDDMDQFLTEVINQRWSFTQAGGGLASLLAVPTQQTMFCRSRVPPLTPPELDRWANELRKKLRKMIKVEQFEQPSPPTIAQKRPTQSAESQDELSNDVQSGQIVKHEVEVAPAVSSDEEMKQAQSCLSLPEEQVVAMSDAQSQCRESATDIIKLMQKRRRKPIKKIKEEALSEAQQESKSSVTESEESRASDRACAPSDVSMDKAASSSKEIVYKRPIKGYVQQANKQTQVTKTEIIEEKGDRKFVCQTCGEVFAHGQALGGHMSRTHPRSSSAYNKKVQRRREREVDRELLRLAKIKHAEEFGQEAPIDRVKIRRYKKELRKSVNRGQLVLQLESQMT